MPRPLSQNEFEPALSRAHSAKPRRAVSERNAGAAVAQANEGRSEAMTENLIREREEQLDAEATPHLFSYTRMQRYLTCPEQYRLYYVEKLRARLESASLVFGALVHLALAEFFRHGVDPVSTFKQEWAALQEIGLRYSRKDSWQGLLEKGERLLEKFVHEEAPKIGKVISVETVFELGLSNLDLPFIGIIDLIAEMKGKRTLVEFKTAVSDFEDHEVALLDQLTVYQVAQPDVEQVAVCVFIKAKKPRIEWHVTKRTPEQVMEFLEKAELVAEQIKKRIFYKRPGKWCRQCEFLPVCLGDRKKAQETLVRIV
jgi:CRISPR/Cas system-associated exonuclease Cas4 (RecB family)